MLSRASLPLCWLAAVVLLRVAGPSVDELIRFDDMPHRLSVAPETALTQLAAAGAWLVLLWLAVGWLAVWGGRARGRAGRMSRGVAAVLVPRVLRGVLEGGVGLSVVLSSAPALAATSAASTPVAATPVAATSVAATSAPRADQLPASLPSLDRDPTTDLKLAPLPAVPAPMLAPETTTGADPVTRGRHPTEPPEVVVRRGDCLWSVVSRALGPEADEAAVARAWPRWYAANRAVIGADPDLLLPGQRLVVPEHAP